VYGLSSVHFFKYKITHIPKSDTHKLVHHPFPCLNKVMAVSPGMEGKRRANEEWSEIWVVGA
jgi:hypothetical protein